MKQLDNILDKNHNLDYLYCGDVEILCIADPRYIIAWEDEFLGVQYEEYKEAFVVFKFYMN